MRIAGQRDAGGLGITDVLLVVLVAQAVAVGLPGKADSGTEGMALVVTILLIENGEVNDRVRRRELLTREEIRSQLRLQGIQDIAFVERA
jgi:uncharacterized membrane protein YcaP (DUF421 family)